MLSQNTTSTQVIICGIAIRFEDDIHESSEPGINRCCVALVGKGQSLRQQNLRQARGIRNNRQSP